jgi:hypothetical protein
MWREGIARVLRERRAGLSGVKRLFRLGIIE